LLYIELALVILYVHLCDIYVHFSLVISRIIVLNSALSRSQSNVYVKFVHEINERKLLCRNYQIPERFDSTRLDCIYMYQEPYTLFISRTVHTLYFKNRTHSLFQEPYTHFISRAGTHI